MEIARSVNIHPFIFIDYAKNEMWFSEINNPLLKIEKEYSESKEVKLLIEQVFSQYMGYLNTCLEKVPKLPEDTQPSIWLKDFASFIPEFRHIKHQILSSEENVISIRIPLEVFALIKDKVLETEERLLQISGYILAKVKDDPYLHSTDYILSRDGLWRVHWELTMFSNLVHTFTKAFQINSNDS